MNILFVDNDVERATLLTRCACRLGCISSAAYNRRTALEFAKNTRFDLVVVNVCRVDPKGPGLCEQIRGGGLSKDALLFQASGTASSTTPTETNFATQIVDRFIEAKHMETLLRDYRKRPGKS